MAEHICPWWIGFLLASPIRRWFQNPEQLLQPYVREGMVVLEPGPGMGFFSLPLARMVGPAGRVIAIDVQPRMLGALRRRARRAGLLDRMELRLAGRDSLHIGDLRGSVDLVVAIAVVHELHSDEVFFREAADALRSGGSLLLIEPRGHVKAAQFTHEMQAADRAGLQKSVRILGGRDAVAVFAK